MEIERREGSVTVSRDRWPGPDTGFMRSGARSARKPKNRAGPYDRAFVVAKKRVMTVERRDAGKVEA